MSIKFTQCAAVSPPQASLDPDLYKPPYSRGTHPEGVLTPDRKGARTTTQTQGQRAHRPAGEP